MDGTRSAGEHLIPAAGSDRPTDLLGIGEFGRRTRLSAKALRIYDELGLVRPARVDPRSGYRWYRPDQADRARVVALLRRLDMPLARISRVVDAAAGAAAAEVDAYWAEVEARTGARRALAHYLRGLLLGGKPMTFDIAVREVPSRSLLTVTRHVAGTEVLGRFLGEALTSFRAAAPAAPVDWPHSCPFVVYYGEVSKDGDGPVALSRPFSAPDPGAGTGAGPTGGVPGATVRFEPAHREAWVRLTRTQALFPVILDAYRALESWAAGPGHDASAPARQIFVSDWRTGGDDDVACDIAIPLRAGPDE